MTTEAGCTFGLIGPLAAFSLRIVAREAERQGHRVHRGMQRRSTHLVIGRGLLSARSERHARERFEAATGADRIVVSESGFLRELGLLPAVNGRTVDARSLLSQSRLDEADFDRLRLFDAFECDREPFTFRDVILARKYAGLIASGARPSDIASSIHRSGPAASLTARSLHADGPGAVYARFEDGMGELTGQLLLELGSDDVRAEEDAFAEAEAFEDEGELLAAAELYRRCLALDPGDAVAAFNRANCLRGAGRNQDAVGEYLRALRIDPSFVEAWFNLADLQAEQDRPDVARRHLRQAISLDPDYADAIYNLARLEFDADDLAEAKRLWQAYLKLDSTSDWARTAIRGIQYVDLQSTRRSAG